MIMMICKQNGQFRILTSRGPALTAEEASRLGKVVTFEELSLVLANVFWPVVIMAYINIFLL